MHPPSHKNLVALFTVVSCANIYAASVTGLEAISYTVVDTSTDTASSGNYTSGNLTPNPLDSSQIVDFSGSGNDGVLLSRSRSLSVLTTAGSNFLVTGSDLNNPVSTTSSLESLNTPFVEGQDIFINATSTHNVTFELENDETKIANFTFGYTMDFDNNVGRNTSLKISWLLTDPDGNDTAIKGSIEETADKATIQIISLTPQITTLTQAGEYNLTVITEIPGQNIKSSKKGFSASLDTFNFEVSSVPEPSSSLLLLCTASGWLMRRRRR